MIETKIYVGLNDSVTRKQIFSTEKYMSVLKNICIGYHVPFSVDMEQGGYFHENGEFTEENSLVLTLIDIDNSLIEEIARDLCVFFNQESVLITEDRVKAYFVQDSIEKL